MDIVSSSGFPSSSAALMNYRCREAYFFRKWVSPECGAPSGIPPNRPLPLMRVGVPGKLRVFASRFHHPMNGVDYQVRLVQLNVMPALIGENYLVVAG